VSRSSRAPRQLSDLQLALMRALWVAGEATVAEVHAALAGERPLAQTTVSTLLTRLEKRGLLRHRTEGRQFVYRALVDEAELNRSMVAELADRLFPGDVTELVHHLLRARDVAPGDLARIKALIEARERELDGAGDG
jgi:predicted transcriptional regulator